MLQGARDNPELFPVPENARKTGTLAYTFMILSMAVTTSIFFLGWFSQILELNMLQTIVAALIGNSVVALIMTLNGYVGIKYGIPFPVQLRPAFGYRGSVLPLLVRVIVSIFWYGIDGYIAAWAITEMAMIIAGVPSDKIVEIALRYTPITFVLYLLFVWAVGYKKITGIKILDSIAGPLLMAFFAWFTYYLTTVPGLPGEFPSLTGGGVEWTSGNFFLMIAVQTAWWSTIALNVSDICRFNASRSVKSLAAAHFAGLVIPQLVGTWLGYVATSLTGGEESPIDIIATYSPSPVLAFFGLLFAALATGSTNVTGDVPAATNGIIRLTGWGWHRSLTMATFLAWLLIGPYSIVRWEKALDVANTLLLFNWYYSMWLGPIAAVMVLDYWVVRRKEYPVEELYKYGESGRFWRGVGYSSGVGWVGVVSFLLGIIGEYVISALQGNLQVYYGFIPVPGIELAWYYGFFISAISYLALSKLVYRG
ncbi:MAG: cytosine permease [Desulfurococcales archaeon]|nr:cytosine permease [Desulfurococcales archaeon]